MFVRIFLLFSFFISFPVQVLSHSKAQLLQAYQNNQHTYTLRTQHLDENNQAKFVNHLILESSPYLLQHAHNPVNWYGFTTEAFNKAQRENKLIFLSIGYATCHWCHVMEEESFDDLSIANYLNQHFVSIKVDREVRPDIDAEYMRAAELLNGVGGWPLNSIITPQGQVFFSGVYFTQQQLLELLQNIQTTWSSSPESITHQAQQIADVLSAHKTNISNIIDPLIINQARTQYLENFDELEGGFETAPKFPQGLTLLFLINQQYRNPSDDLLEAITTTLNAMAMGGLYDAIGGGFHRYSVDSAWRFPHFEKMLYNQAQLALVYTRAYALTQKPHYRYVAEQTIDFILRQMQHQQGGFFSAMDADSEGEEGRYYTWEISTIKQVLSQDEWMQFNQYFDLSNYTEFEQRHVIRLKAIDDLSTHDWATIQQLSEKLLQYRNQQVVPLIDKKIILSWNTLLIPSLLEAAQAFDNTHYQHQALILAEYLHSFKQSNRYYRIRINDQLQTPALLEDYAYLANAYLSVFDATGQAIWLDRTIEIIELMNENFWDKTQLSFNSNVPSPYLNYQHKVSADEAIPSGNASAYQALVKLARRTNNTTYLKQANKLLRALSTTIRQDPINHASFMTAFDNSTHGELSNTQYLYQGRVIVTSQFKQNQQARIKITLQPNWHINAHQPIQESLIGTQIKNLDTDHWSIINQQYPEGKVKQLGFSKEAILIYEDVIEIVLDLSPHSSNYTPPKLQLKLQACSDQICLAPSSLLLKL